MNYNYNNSNPEKYTSKWFLNESNKRESLARYFLTVPPEKQRNKTQSATYIKAVRDLCGVEIKSIIGYEGERALRFGDVTSLVRNTLDAISVVLDKNNKLINYNIPKMNYFMSVDCKLLQLALTKIVVCCLQDKNILDLEIKLGVNHLAFIVKNDGLVKDKQTLSLLKTVLQLHKGTLVVTNDKMAFSFNNDLPNKAGMFSPPSSSELLSDPLSYVNIALA